MFGALAEFERSLIRGTHPSGPRRRPPVRPHRGGRPPENDEDDIEAAKAILANPDIGVTQIAHRLGVSPATLYRETSPPRQPRIPRPSEYRYTSSGSAKSLKGQELDQMDATVMLYPRRQHRMPPPCARLQPSQSHAHAGVAN